MAREEQVPDSKAHLVEVICSAAAAFSACVRRRNAFEMPVFVDWYLILRVDEDVKVDVIRRRYRQLALQLHPDKNKHPKADEAFKFVSEAYACLSDKAKRQAFDRERGSHFCKECYERFNCRGHGNKPSHEKKHTRQTRLRQMQMRFREEFQVVERCLRVNQARRDESPLFDPYKQGLSSPGYPHSRQVRHQWHFSSACESPLYEMGNDKHVRTET
ncbi:chaperone protein DnaJ-like [Zingiber officinale]|uniref:J domain-containing protein n=1 Tax=Zingiber officinale TaxID=94328 RepID=A0A8J5G6U1_ZINOF|nr:chaperone protein DnaJ-like [Zingiber officinale]KAG6496939.1 hypothetical protein ZIOFF_044819 [Zingiber officinale]